MNIRFLFFILFCFIANSLNAQNFEITSPNERIKLKVTVGDQLSWQVTLDNKPVISEATIGMDFSNGPDFGKKAKVKKDSKEVISTKIYPVLPHKDAEIKDEYTQLTLTLEGNYQIRFRAYDDGVAYQFVDQGKLERNVLTEEMSLIFPTGTKSLFPKEESLYSHYERSYLDVSLEQLTNEDFCSLPVLFMNKDAKVLFTETALHNYPGLFLKGSKNTEMTALFPKYVLEAIDNEKEPDRSQIIKKEADYIAKVEGERNYPWRVFIISDDDRVLVESNLTFQLAKPVAIEDTEWIKPGKVAWDWYNANNIFGVDFESGLNTTTYKYYIDFAAANGIEYVILDEGWTKSTTEILGFNPDMDVQEIIDYGKAKGVGIILWVLWKPLDENMTEILETYSSWGAKGVKVDFMQRHDQYMVSSYERIVKECARLKLLVDYHGAFKPSGLRRMYPNMINYEGVKGSEHNKWSQDISPEHNVTLPFTRMVAGPLDYTPGAMLNRQEKNHSISFERPMSLGTRAHQVAMYVVYESPLQMLCESPSRYYKEQETVDFIVNIPTSWDETKVLHAAVSDYIVIARRKGDKWYIGAMTDWDARELEINLDFLDDGTYKMEIFKDGKNANRFAEDYQIDRIKVNKSSTLSINMAKGGGWTAILSK